MDPKPRPLLTTATPSCSNHSMQETKNWGRRADTVGEAGLHGVKFVGEIAVVVAISVVAAITLVVVVV